MTTVEKIKAIEDEMAKTQKNKVLKRPSPVEFGANKLGNVISSWTTQGARRLFCTSLMCM